MFSDVVKITTINIIFFFFSQKSETYTFSNRLKQTNSTYLFEFELLGIELQVIFTTILKLLQTAHETGQVLGFKLIIICISSSNGVCLF